MIQGNVFNIQRYTIHDGPGIRTEIFLKGCPLACKWCGNPESWSLEPQPGVYPSRCIGKETCGLCADACEREGGLRFGEAPASTESVEPQQGRLTAINRNLCIGCMACVESCPADAIKAWGTRMSEDQVMECIRRDIRYYQSSGGGVTISGGEPLMQAAFTKAILKKCREEGIHTCLESTFCMDWDIIEGTASHADMLITDIKHMNSAVHKAYTGVSNERILQNLRRLPSLGKPVTIRIPVIPAFNDHMDHIKAAADFILKEMEGRVQQLQLLGFMRLGEEKYRSLGMEYPMKDLKFDRNAFQERIQEMAAYCSGRGIYCTVGTKEIV